MHVKGDYHATARYEAIRKLLWAIALLVSMCAAVSGYLEFSLGTGAARAVGLIIGIAGTTGVVLSLWQCDFNIF